MRFVSLLPFCWQSHRVTICTTRDYVPLVNLIGVFFQIRDDLMNLQSTEVVRLPPSLTNTSHHLVVIHSIHQIKVSRKILRRENSLSQWCTVYMPTHPIDKSSVSEAPLKYLFATQLLTEDRFRRSTKTADDTNAKDPHH